MQQRAFNASSRPAKTVTKQPEPVNLKTEIDQIRRIVNGANKRLERLAEQLKDK